MDKKWEEMTREERQEAMFAGWVSPPGAKWDSPEAEKDYKARANRVKDAIQMKKTPDRVPIIPMLGFFPAFYAGMTPKDVMYDYEKLDAAFTKYMLELQPDTHFGLAIPGPGRVLDILDYKLYSWPGHGVAAEHSYQANEAEYMTPDEYDALIKDPSYFFNSIYLPRVIGVMEPMKKLPHLTNIQEIVFVGANMIPYGDPEVQAAYQKMFEAGNEAMKWAGFLGAYEQKMTAAGFPVTAGGFSKVPYDVIGDTLRGTRGIMMDIFRRPEKVLEAIDAITPLMIEMGVQAAKAAGNPLVVIPLHKGADGFLSKEQFEKFYWPNFKALLMGLIEEGCVPFSFVEGSYNTRLEYLAEIPKGTSFWVFDTTDMAKAKEILGKTACIGGNVPSDMLNVSTPERVEAYVKQLIDTCAPGGGYIMSNGVSMDEAKPENVRAMIETTKKYGVYK